jgi:hypothetical protein
MVSPLIDSTYWTLIDSTYWTLIDSTYWTLIDSTYWAVNHDWQLLAGTPDF